MKNKILITSALPYANGPLHFGHIAGAYLPGDVYARFQRLMQNDVLYVCGSDEYGIAITISAEKAGRTPQEHVNIFHEVNKDFFQKLNMSFDNYSRTTWEGHPPLVHQYFTDLLNNGYIEEKVTEQLYSEADRRFLADRYVVGTCPKCGFASARGDECPQCGASYEATDLINPRSKLSDAPLVLKPTKHWFLLLDKFKDKLLGWLETKNWKPNVVNFIKSYIEDLRPRAITRDMTWGVSIPLPDAGEKVLYVWFDAPIGYISASVEWALKEGSPDLWKSYWCDPQTKLVHFLGKDNIPFHAAIFPAMTMGQNQPYKLVDELPANEFFNLEGRQFSKSDGWYIDLEDFFKNYSTDQIRYTIAANAPETSDSEFTWKDFQTRCNTELLGKYGNLVNRVLVFARNNCAGRVPSLQDLQPIDEDFLKSIKQLVREAAICYETFKVRRASQIIMELAQLGNVYFDAKKPWKDAKDPDTKHSMETTIACCLECLKALALISQPIIPESADKVWKMLGYVSQLEHGNWPQIVETPIPAHQHLKDPSILFKKVEDEQISLELTKLKEMSKKAELPQTKSIPDYAPLKEMVDIEDVRKLDLRVGVIKSAKNLPKSKKLLLVEVDLGFEVRTVIAGISQHYQPENLMGKKVIIVANLKPATLMGHTSHGMLLAASEGDHLELISVEEILPGAQVS
ncbi:MAG: methionine--tRNA ligase [Chlamydiales bacterium 38-26]|nr:methionine--tRNA ligase [Chlamydiales bacterium]OJV09233.1 MAG: methionine--tRNA ligase [Chlamydiales bacterium 38-26]